MFARSGVAINWDASGDKTTSYTTNTANIAAVGGYNNLDTGTISIDVPTNITEITSKGIQVLVRMSMLE